MVTPPLLSRIAAAGIGAGLTLTESGDLRLTTAQSPASPPVRPTAAQGGAPAAPVINPADRWAPPPAPPPLLRGRDLSLPTMEALARCRAILLERYHDRGFVALLSEERGADDARRTVGGGASRAGGGPFVRRAATLLREQGAAALVGLGPGLTPAGDDFLSGMVLAEDLGAAIHRQDGAGPEPVTATPLRRPLDRGRIGAALRRTTPAGASLLRLALAGYPPTYQILMVEALAAGHDDHAIAIATAHGHSSGLDALAGFLYSRLSVQCEQAGAK